MTGTVTRVFLTRGFAFVRGDDGLEYFLQAEEVPGGANQWGGAATPRVGARVEFTPFHDPKGRRSGLRATKVEFL